MRGYRSRPAITLSSVLLVSVLALPADSLAVGPPGVPPPAALERIISADTADTADTDDPTLKQMVGQKIVTTMAGRKLGKALAGRIRRGEIGGVVLLARNVTTRSALKRLTRQLQRAASAGGQPPLLISIDQEGGSVRRVRWAPPTLTVPQMGRLGSTDVARTQGARTGAALRGLGINIDLAPVADVPRSSASFMYQQGRTFSFDSKRTARLADAFAAGLGSRGVLATMKHFPGIGLATRNTDLYVDTIRAPKAGLQPDLRPYRRAIRNDIPLIMLSNAAFTAYDRKNAAGWSRAIVHRLLRRDLGFEGVTITDSLNGTANARGMKIKTLATRAARVGTDLILVTGSEKSSSWLYRALLDKARQGSIPVARLRASYDRILVLKESLRNE